MRKVLKDTDENRKFLETLQKIYVIGYWAGYGTREYYYAGKVAKDGIPYVYSYYDGNGTCGVWHLIRVDHTTSGQIWAWSTDRNKAEHLAKLANIAVGEGTLKEIHDAHNSEE